MKKSEVFLLVLATFVFILPESVLASSGIDEFATPAQAIVDTLTGTVGKLICVALFAISGLYYLWKGGEITDTFKGVLKTLMGISVIAFASTIVVRLFVFSGAVI